MMRVFETGEATWEEDKLLMMERAGYLEEAYFSYSFTPVFDAAGKVSGIFTPVIETTSRVLSERRLKTLGRLAACAPDSKTTLEVGITRQTYFPSLTPQSCGFIQQACRSIIDALRDNKDVPYAALYLTHDGGKAHLMATTLDKGGASTLSPDLPRVVHFGSHAEKSPPTRHGHHEPEKDELRWPIEEALEKDEPQYFAAQHPCSSRAMLIPLNLQPGSQKAVIVVGLNKYRALDAEYSEWLRVAAGQITTTLNQSRVLPSTLLQTKKVNVL